MVYPLFFDNFIDFIDDSEKRINETVLVCRSFQLTEFMDPTTVTVFETAVDDVVVGVQQGTQLMTQPLVELLTARSRGLTETFPAQRDQ